MWNRQTGVGDCCHQHFVIEPLCDLVSTDLSLQTTCSGPILANFCAQATLGSETAKKFLCILNYWWPSRDLSHFSEAQFFCCWVRYRFLKGLNSRIAERPRAWQFRNVRYCSASPSLPVCLCNKAFLAQRRSLKPPTNYRLFQLCPRHVLRILRITRLTYEDKIIFSLRRHEIQY